jgi:two-component system, cell cycle sensor histidine kinase and response regulator CckA
LGCIGHLRKDLFRTQVAAARLEGAMSSVMVVENERIIARDISDSLIAMGYEVTGTAATAAECVQSAAQRRPDLVLMDIHLAGELDGIEAAHLLRERFALPVVFLTAYADDKTLDRAKLAGALGYLTKPFRKPDLRSAVEVGLFRHAREREVRERERWSSILLRSLGDAVIAVDSEGHVSFMNTAAEELVGRRQHDMCGQALSEVLQLLNESTRAPIDDSIARAMDQREVVQLPPSKALTSGGRELLVESSVAPILDDRKAVLGAMVVLRDLSSGARQEQSASADGFSSLATVAASLAHEINNPLSYILSNAYVARQELSRMHAMLAGEDPPVDSVGVRECFSQAADLLLEVEEGVRHIGRIAADLGSLGQRESDLKPLDIIPTVEWALRVSHSTLKHHARVRTRLRPLPPVRGDAVRLCQIFLNLTLNAAHAMSGRPFEENELLVCAELDREGQVCISVTDTGSGMTPEVMERIFDPFFTTKPVGSGTGLGLSVCRRAVRSMGGSISVRSAPGQGSTFVVKFPALLAPAELSAAATMPARLLLIDDDPRVLAGLRRMLLASAYDVVTAQNAADALRELESGEQFDVVLCDLVMPEMDGMALYERLCRTAPHLAEKFVFVTGGGNTESALQFLKGQEILRKPVTRADLSNAVRRKLAHVSAARL